MNYHCVCCQEPSLVTSLASSNSTLASVASSEQWNFWNTCQVCARLPEMIRLATECLKRRGPPQSGSRRSPPFGPITSPSSFNPRLSLADWENHTFPFAAQPKLFQPPPLAERTRSFITLDGSQAWSAQQHHTRKLR